MDWFGVRSVYRYDGVDEPDAYEERVVLFQADDFEAAIAMAEAEAAEYVAVLGCEVTSCFQAYRLPEDPGVGAEVFSLIRRSDLAPEAYVDQFFSTGNEHQRSVE